MRASTSIETVGGLERAQCAGGTGELGRTALFFSLQGRWRTQRRCNKRGSVGRGAAVCVVTVVVGPLSWPSRCRGWRRKEVLGEGDE